ncbi:MAG: hypothetical protein K5906_04250 [Bacilli bacterium]|nr:hypothetical protein [Bacilli bacterium]
MANTDLAFRFTEEKYASKSEVMKDLNTSLVDNIWANIINYRKQYNIGLGIHSFNKSEYVLCNCQFVISKNAQAEMKLLRVMKETSALADEDFKGLEFICYQSLLRSVAKNNELDDSEIRMRGVLRNEFRTLDRASLILPRYIEALNYIKKNYVRSVDLNFISEVHGLLVGDPFSNFRKVEDDSAANRVVIDRIYTSAPVNLIEPLMLELCDFINNSSLNPIIKAYIAYYFIIMVKPFARYSEETAALIAKDIIARESMGEIACILPLEHLLIEPNEDLAKLYNNIQRYNDMTYFVRYGLDFNEGVISLLIDKIVDYKAQLIKEEFYAPDVEEKKAEPAPAVESTPIPEPLPKVEEKKVEVKPEPVKREEKRIVIQEERNEPALDQLAINYVPRGLDEREAARLEVHLLELDPSLKKGEAKFYARHCTLGKMYTIQQFKQANRCAYETARTGMEHLVQLGYYRKEQIKNKFVYTPINRR